MPLIRCVFDSPCGQILGLGKRPTRWCLLLAALVSEASFGALGWGWAGAPAVSLGQIDSSPAKTSAAAVTEQNPPSSATAAPQGDKSPENQKPSTATAKPGVPVSNHPPAPAGNASQAKPLEAAPQEPTPEHKPSAKPTEPGPPTPGVPPPVPLRGGAVSFRLENADLLQFVGLVANQLQLNYVVDPAVKGTVNITTAGELRREDLLPILETVLRINGATAIQTGNFYRIVPLAQAPRTPLAVYNDATGKTLPSDDRMMMQIIPLGFVSAADMAKMLTPFLSDGATLAIHESGNILILVDNSSNVKRLMEVLGQFDSIEFARERVRLVPIHNNVASGLAPELESIFGAYALSSKNTPIRFVALDRINALLVVTPDPSAFGEVERWIDRLDQPAPPSGIQTFIYRVQNTEADYLARMLSAMLGGAGRSATPAGATGGAGSAKESGAAGADVEPVALTQSSGSALRIVTDPINNSLIFQCTAQQYAEIVKTLKDLDVVPRQVYIEGRVYEVTLTGDLTFGVNYFLQHQSGSERKPLASFSAQNALQASAGTVVGQTRELLAFLNASENRTRVRVLSAPTVLATDNTEARIQVGSEVPVLTSQAVVGGVTVGSTSVFSNTVQNRDTGIILTVQPRITSTGLVSLKVTQEISNAVPAAAGGIRSPSFLKRTIATHATLRDGDTVALGGLMTYTINTTRNRVPLLGDIPVLGALFGSTTYNRTETELIVVLTPHILNDLQAAHNATQDLRDKLKDLRRSFKEDKVMNP